MARKLRGGRPLATLDLDVICHLIVPLHFNQLSRANFPHWTGNPLLTGGWSRLEAEGSHQLHCDVINRAFHDNIVVFVEI